MTAGPGGEAGERPVTAGPGGEAGERPVTAGPGGAAGGRPVAGPAVVDPVLTVDGLCIDYHGETLVHAVQDVTFALARTEILGLAGDRGCGKSTLAYGIVRLLKPPGMITAGRIGFRSRDGAALDLRALDGEQLRAFRWSQISLVFQGAMNSLNPVISVRAQLEDVFSTHRPQLSRRERRQRCGDLLERVGVDRSRLRAYPHELSGGMRQRVMIAMAMALDPQVMIMDEPTTALDVVVQREILAEITRLREEFGFAMLFITHDLPLLLEISDRIAVMRHGRIVELRGASQLFTDPRHDYTRQLLSSFPSLAGHRDGLLRAGPVPPGDGPPAEPVRPGAEGRRP